MWYRSTVLETREQKNELDPDLAPIKEIYVGYRIYSEEEGHKIDERDQRKFIGWSYRYDVWLPFNSPQIQRFNSISRHYSIASKSTLIYEN